jgi:hypothetical protein
MKRPSCSILPRPVSLNPDSWHPSACAGGLLAALILTVVPVAALAQDEAITKNTEPSTVRILGQVGNGQWAGGSGFVVALQPASPRRLDHNERFYLAHPRFMFEVKEGGR